MNNSPKSPNYQAAAAAQAGPTAPPARNGPIDWSQNTGGPTGPGAGYGIPDRATGMDTNAMLPKNMANPLEMNRQRLDRQALNGVRSFVDPGGLVLGGQGGNFGENLVRSVFDPAGIFSSKDPKKIKGSIDPETGSVDVSNYKKFEPGLEAAFTSMLRTGNVPPELKNLKGAAKKLKNQIKDFRATGGVDGGAWEWNTPSSGMPTTIPGQGTINWGNSPGMSATPPAPGAPPTQTPPPQAGGGTSPNGWQRPAALPSPDPYKAQQIQALRSPNAQSRLMPAPPQRPGGV